MQGQIDIDVKEKQRSDAGAGQGIYCESDSGLRVRRLNEGYFRKADATVKVFFSLILAGMGS